MSERTPVIYKIDFLTIPKLTPNARRCQFKERRRLKHPQEKKEICYQPAIYLVAFVDKAPAHIEPTSQTDRFGARKVSSTVSTISIALLCRTHAIDFCAQHGIDLPSHEIPGENFVGLIGRLQ